MNGVLESPSQAVREQILPVQQLQPNPWNRKTFNAQGLQELSDSVKSKGILEPLIVRHLTDGKYEIASGERRWRAAQLAGFKEVPCHIQDLTDDDVQDMNLVSNIQREDIPAMEKAAMVKALIKPGMTQDQIARKLGKSRQWVTDLLGFLDLPDVVQQHLSDTPLGMRQLQAIAALPNDSYQEQLAREIKEGRVPPAKVEHRAHQLHNGFKAAMAKRYKKAASGVAAGPVVTVAPADVVSKSSAPSDPVGGPLLPTKASMGSLPVAAGNDGKNGSSTTQQLLTALKDDVADNYLPSFGRVGGVMRAALDKAWAAPRQLVKWGVIFAAVSWLWHPVLKTINYAFTRLMHVEVNREINKNTVPPVAAIAAAVAESPKKFTEAMLTTIPAPTGLAPELLSGKRVHFTWNAVPGCVGYNFYSAHSTAANYFLESKKPLSKNEGIWSSNDGPGDFRFVVTALDGHDHESPYSEPVDVDLR